MNIKTCKEIMQDTISPDSFCYVDDKDIELCMKKYAEQFIELAAEEAETEEEWEEDYPYSKVFISSKVDKESILRIKEQIK